MRVDSAVVGMTGDQNISEKEKKKIKKNCRKKDHKHLAKKCNKQQTMNDTRSVLQNAHFPIFFLLFTSHSALDSVLCLLVSISFSSSNTQFYESRITISPIYGVAE